MKLVNLDNIVEIYLGITHTPEYVNEGIPFLSVKDISKGKIDFSNCKYISVEEFNTFPKGAKPQKGDILFCRVGTIGKPIIVSEDIPEFGSFVSLGYLRLKSDNWNPEFIKYWMESNLFCKQVKQNTKGASQVNLNTTWLKKFMIPMYSIEKQNKIVKELNEITNCITKYNLNIVNYDNIVKSQFIEMFGTIDLSEERKEWEEICNVTKIYTGTTPSTSDESNWDGEILWITPAEMNFDTFFVYDTVRKITEKGRKSKSLDLMPTNTVLLSTRAPIGKVGIVGTPMTSNQGFKNFECLDRLNPIYLYTLLKNNTEYLNSLGSGTTFLEVSKSTISKMRIPMPKIELQNKFAAFVQQIDKSKYIILSYLITQTE